MSEKKPADVLCGLKSVNTGEPVTVAHRPVINIAVKDEAERQRLVPLMAKQYAIELDTNRNYLTLEQLITDIKKQPWAKDEEDFLSDTAELVFRALEDIDDYYVYGWRVRVGGRSLKWLALPRSDARYARVIKPDKRTRIRVSDPEPFPDEPSEEAWRRWTDKTIALLVGEFNTAYVFTERQVERSIDFKVMKRRGLPNHGIGVERSDAEQRIPPIVSRVMEELRELGCWSVVNPLGEEHWLPPMKPIKAVEEAE